MNIKISKAALSTVFSLLLATPVIAADGYYSWQDENDITHFAKTPPLNVDSTSHDFANQRDFHSQYQTPPAASKPAQAVKSDTKEPAATETVATDTGTMPLVYEKDPQRCAQAQKNLRALDSARPIRVTDENGAKSLLSADQKAQQRELATEVMRIHC